jgi:hypothetical protein
LDADHPASGVKIARRNTDVLADSTTCGARPDLDSSCKRLLDVVALALEGTGLLVVEAHLQLRFGRYALRLRLRRFPTMLDDWPSDHRDDEEWGGPFCLQ